MNRLTVLALSGMTAVTLLPSVVLPSAYAADILTEALTGGKAVIQIRPRLELVEQDTPTADSATSLTVRSVLGYETAPIQGIKAYVEFEDIRAIVDNYSVPVIQPNAKYAVVADPELTQVNQAFLSGYGVKLGRQKIVIDNARFVGDVIWRQNDQVFDAISYQTKDIAPWLDLYAAYATQVNGITGQSGDVELPIVYAKASTPIGANIGLMWVGLKGKETTGLGSTLSASSRQHTALRVEGKQQQFLYDLSYAKQDNYAGSAVPDADYYSVTLGYDFGKAKLSVQQESLESGFATPLATLHAFNGWADKFLATPAAGLVDTNIKLTGAYAGFNLTGVLHRFESDVGGIHYGDELNLSAARRVNPKTMGLLKLAHYQAKDGAGALGVDQTKLWLQLDYKF